MMLSFTTPMFAVVQQYSADGRTPVLTCLNFTRMWQEAVLHVMGDVSKCTACKMLNKFRRCS